MPLNQKLTDKPQKTTPSSEALIHIVEPNDFSQGSDGSDYKVLVDDLLPQAGQDNIDIRKNVNILSTDTYTQILAKINALANYTVNEKQSVWFICRQVTSGAGQLPRVIKYKMMLLGKGNYGTGGTQLTFDNLENIYDNTASLLDIENNPTTDKILYGDLVGETISEWLNVQDPAIVIQPQEDGYTLFEGSIDGIDTSYLWIGLGGVYGLGDTQSTMADFQVISDEVSENYVKLNPSPETSQTIQETVIIRKAGGIGTQKALSIVNANTEAETFFIDPDGSVSAIEYNGTSMRVSNAFATTPTGGVDGSILTRKDWVEGLLALKADLVAGKVPASQLPSYVDDILEYPDLASFPVTGEDGKLYVALDTNLVYRWSGSAYVEISQSLALGETSSTAYRGDRGKTAYDHSQITSGNPHGTTKSDIGLSNADNTSDINKPVSTAQQTALDLKANDADVLHKGSPETITGVKKIASDVGLMFSDFFTWSYNSVSGILNLTTEDLEAGTIAIKKLNGFIGFGTTNPTHRVDVNGTFRSTGEATVAAAVASTSAIQKGQVDALDANNVKLTGETGQAIEGLIVVDDLEASDAITGLNITANERMFIGATPPLAANEAVRKDYVDGLGFMSTINATTSALSLSTLNSTYATNPVGFEVICADISGTPLIYKKTDSSKWHSIPITVVS